MSIKPEAESTTVEKVAAKALANEATFASLSKKPRRTLSFTITSQDEDGEPITLSLKYRALSNLAYDELLAAHPPTGKQKQGGASYNVDSFAPAIISACSVVPLLTVAQAREVYTSEDWSGGEVSSLFINALRVNNAGLDVPFNAAD